MVISLVSIHVKPEAVEAFKVATIENSRNSVLEPGIARFDFTQQVDDPTRFVLIEVFRDEAATVAHRATRHYQTWRDTVADMMASPRTLTRLSTVFPGDESWS
jgi:quinol monooxygenase YgiN